MVEGTIRKRLNTPAVARRIALNEIAVAASSKDGELALVVGRVFTAFMFEGVIGELGAVLCPTWNEALGDRRPLARMSLACRHKWVRSVLELENGDVEYDRLRLVLQRLFKFRDNFAHPKKHGQTIEVVADSAEEVATMLIAWEPDLNPREVSADYQTIEAYCLDLLSRAAGLLERYSKWDMSEERMKRFPHLSDRDLELEADLNAFLHSRFYNERSLRHLDTP